MLPTSVVQFAKFTGERQVEAVIVRVTALIAVAVIHRIGHAVDGVLSAREGDRLACVVNPVGGHADAFRYVIVGDNDEIVGAVVRRRILLVMADALNGAESTAIGVGNPSRELAHILSDE